MYIVGQFAATNLGSLDEVSSPTLRIAHHPIPCVHWFPTVVLSMLSTAPTVRGQFPSVGCFATTATLRRSSLLVAEE